MGKRIALLTGLPRGGTTLACRLFNELSDVVALVEPMDVSKFTKLSPRAAILDAIEQFANEQRMSLMANGLAISRHVGGTVTDNLFAPVCELDGLRRFHATHGMVNFGKALSSEFTLIIKHPAAFTALLGDLVKRFRCYAIIRNPLAVLASWNTTNMPVRNGHAPAAEQHDPDLKRALEKIDDRFDRQLFLLSWYLNQYQKHLPTNHMIRYEDVINSGGSALSVVKSSAVLLNESLTNSNQNPVYDKETTLLLGEKLLTTEGNYWNFYSRDEIQKLMGRLR